METSVVQAADDYLEHHGHTRRAYEFVSHVLDRYTYLAELARDRAIGELALDAQIIELFPIDSEPA